MNPVLQKRKTIRKKISDMAILISSSSLLLASFVGLFGMMSIRSRSTQALIRQTEENLMSVITHKAEVAQGDIERITDFAEMFSDYAHRLYVNKNHYKPHPVLPPNPENAGKYAIQRCLAGESYKIESFREEMNLLGNLEEIYSTVIKVTSDIGMNIYAGSESGFLIGYDRDSGYDEGEEEPSGEDYYNYFQSEWYKKAKSSKSIGFTDVYSDSIGRGLMISCYAPFYNEKDIFAGAFCLDLHIDKLYQTLVDMTGFTDSYAFLIDKQGNTITSGESKNIFKTSTIDSAITGKLRSLNMGVELAEDGNYYAYAPIMKTEWVLCLCIPKKSVLTPIFDMNRHILYAIIVFVLFLVLVLLVVMLVTRRFSISLTRPLEVLTKDVQEISRGNLDQKAQIFDNDEIGDVANGINAMALSLKDYIASLTSVTAEKEKISTELNVANQVQQIYTKMMNSLSGDKNAEKEADQS